MELTPEFFNLIFRFGFNLSIAFIIIKLIYYRNHNNNDFVFTYFMFNSLIFFFATILISSHALRAQGEIGELSGSMSLTVGDGSTTLANPAYKIAGISLSQEPVYTGATASATWDGPSKTGVVTFATEEDIEGNTEPAFPTNHLASGTVLVTADHGNAEQMWDPVAECPHTAHTNFTVPFHLVGDRFRDVTLRSDGRLADIAPTILSIMELDTPDLMSGRTLHMNR